MAVGTTHGFKIFNCDPLSLCYDYLGKHVCTNGLPQDDNRESGARIVSMLFCTSMIGVVGLGDGRLRLTSPRGSSETELPLGGGPSNSIPKGTQSVLSWLGALSSARTLSLINTKHGSVMYDLRFPSTIFHVQMNRKRLLVNCDGQVFIYDMSTMAKLFYLTIPSSSFSFTAVSSGEGKEPTDDGVLLPTLQVSTGRHIVSLSPNSEEPYFAIPDISSPGDLLVYDAFASEPVNATTSDACKPKPALKIVQAHKSPLVYVKFNTSGNLIATASDKVIETCLPISHRAQSLGYLAFQTGFVGINSEEARFPYPLPICLSLRTLLFSWRRLRNQTRFTFSACCHLQAVDVALFRHLPGFN